MKVSYGEGVATHTGPESCGVVRKGSVEALTGVRAGRVSRPRKKLPPGCRRCKGERKATPRLSRYGERQADPARSKTPGTYGSTSRENREIRCLPVRAGRVEKSKDVRRR